MNKEAIWIKNPVLTNKNGGRIISYRAQDDGRRNISISEYSQEITVHLGVDDETKNLIQKAMIEAKSAVQLLDFSYQSVTLQLPWNKKNDIVTFISVIADFLPIQSIKKDIFDSLKLEAIPNREVFLEELEQLVALDNLDEARTKVDSVDTDDNILFEYATLLKKEEKYPEALAVYQEIEEKNPNYSAANEAALQIVLSYEDNAELSEEEKEYYLESKVRLMLKINNPEAQKDLDRHFSQFSGNEFSQEMIPEIKVDEDTIINLGKELKVLNQKNQLLEQEMEELRQELAKAKAGLALINSQQAFFKAEQPENTPSSAAARSSRSSFEKK